MNLHELECAGTKFLDHFINVLYLQCRFPRSFSHNNTESIIKENFPVKFIFALFFRFGKLFDHGSYLIM